MKSAASLRGRVPVFTFVGRKTEVGLEILSQDGVMYIKDNHWARRLTFRNESVLASRSRRLIGDSKQGKRARDTADSRPPEDRTGPANLVAFDDDIWELYDTSTDWSQAST
jgi:hypothetical protein